MTALTRYQRLESTGLWRPAPDQARRDVVVAFGNATLVIADGVGRPLAHWSLPAVVRVATEADGGVVFAPDPDASETLTLTEPEMIAAIDQVRRAIAGPQMRPVRMRQALRWTAAGLLLLVAGLWLPGALTRQVTSTLPALKRSEIGAMLLGHLQRQTGPSCRADIAAGALDRLALRLFGNHDWQIVVLPPGPDRALAGPVALPGQIIVLPSGLLQGASNPAGLAAALLQAARQADPLAAMLQHSGLRATLTLLTRGDLPDAELAAYATVLLSGPAQPVDPVTVTGTEPVMSDGDWVALLAICAG